MNPSTVKLVIWSIIIAVIAWFLYKAKFKLKEITVKTGIVEAKMERDNGIGQTTERSKPHTEANQEATDGGRIIPAVA